MTDATPLSKTRLDIISELDLEVLSRQMQGYSIKDGYNITAQGTPDDTVVVGSGNSFFAGALVNRAAPGNVSFDACSATLDRIDVIYAHSTGTVLVHKGDNFAVSDPLGNGNWLQYTAPYTKASIPSGAIIGKVYILHQAGGTPIIQTAHIFMGVAKSADAYILHALATVANDFLVASGSGAFIKKTLAETKTILGVVEGAAGFWTAFPGTPARVSDTSFSVTDTGNANLYDKMYSPGTIIKWEKSGGGFQVARIITAAYATNTVTYTLKGNTLAAGFTDMKYCIHKSLKEVFYVPGTMPGNTATVNIGKTWIPDCDILIFDARSRYETAPTTTAGVWDINDDGATIQTTKLSQTAGQNLGVDTQCDSTLATATTVIAKDSIVTIDYDSGHATTPGADAMIEVWWIPEAWRYLS